MHPYVVSGVVLGFCFFLNMAAGGMTQAFSVFMSPVADGLQLDWGTIASVSSITLMVSGLFAPVTGMLFDHWGPLRVYALGAALLGVGYYIASGADSLWELYLALGVMIGMGGSMVGGVPASGLVNRWFVRRTGAAIGLIFSSYGIGIFMVSPASEAIISAFDWRVGYQVYALFFAILLPLLLLFPWGQIERGHPLYRRSMSLRAASQIDEITWTLATAMRTASFWGLFSVFFFTGGATTGLTIHMVSYLTSIGMDSATAAWAFGFSGLLAPIGMVGFGFLSDTIGRTKTVLLSYILTFLAITGFYLLSHYTASIVLLVLTIAVNGLSSGSRGPIVSSMTMNIFGGARLGGIYGTISLGGGLGSAFGVWMGGLLKEYVGTPEALLGFFFVLALIGSLPFWTIPNLKRH